MLKLSGSLRKKKHQSVYVIQDAGVEGKRNRNVGVDAKRYRAPPPKPWHAERHHPRPRSTEDLWDVKISQGHKSIPPQQWEKLRLRNRGLDERAAQRQCVGGGCGAGENAARGRTRRPVFKGKEHICQEELCGGLKQVALKRGRLAITHTSEKQR